MCGGGDRDEEQLKDGLWGAAPTLIFLFSLMWDLWSKQTSPALRWGETPTPSALKPYPVCAPAQAWELPGLWLGINIPCPGRGSVSTQRDHSPHSPQGPTPKLWGAFDVCLGAAGRGPAHQTVPSYRCGEWLRGNQGPVQFTLLPFPRAHRV